MRWWDGTQWSPHTQPLPAVVQEPQLPHPGADGSAFSGYGWQQGAPQDDVAYTPNLETREPPPASFPPGQPQQTDPYQPQGWPGQHPYAPGPQLRGHRASRRPRNRRARRALIALGALIGIIAAISVATIHNSPSAGNAAATSTASSASTASAAASSASASQPGCESQLISWRNNGGASQIEAVATDMGNLQQPSSALATDMSTGADASQDEASLQTAAASLQSDAQTAQTNLPPACVPNMRADEGAGLNDASKAALDAQDAVSEMGSGNYGVATGDMNAANTAIIACGKKFQAATADLQAFSTG